ncbi:hypothetical protein VTN77DRAFT_5985 [Rasamsonia byssochlamydoides]|uniref:uncharacterized protein n=1 Tax=Rasamsonia byssochlamydoides TaxID=89139 RepID=UPI00374237C3
MVCTLSMRSGILRADVYQRLNDRVRSSSDVELDWTRFNYSDTTVAQEQAGPLQLGEWVDASGRHKRATRLDAMPGMTSKTGPRMHHIRYKYSTTVCTGQRPPYGGWRRTCSVVRSTTGGRCGCMTGCQRDLACARYRRWCSRKQPDTRRRQVGLLAPSGAVSPSPRLDAMRVRVLRSLLHRPLGMLTVLQL